MIDSTTPPPWTTTSPWTYTAAAVTLAILTEISHREPDNATARSLQANALQAFREAREALEGDE